MKLKARSLVGAFLLFVFQHPAGLIAPKPSDPRRVSWTADKALVVFTGDLIDKGNASLAVIALVRTLQIGAASAGGRVVILMGNHEAEFLASPDEKKVKNSQVSCAQSESRQVR